MTCGNPLAVGLTGFEPATPWYQPSRPRACHCSPKSGIDLREHRKTVLSSCHRLSLVGRRFRGVNGGRRGSGHLWGRAHGHDDPAGGLRRDRLVATAGFIGSDRGGSPPDAGGWGFVSLGDTGTTSPYSPVVDIEVARAA